MYKLGKILLLLASIVAWQGCSSSSDNGDASTTDAGPFLSRGANLYLVSDVIVTSDACMVLPASVKNTRFPVNFDDATQILSVGRQVGSPLQPSLGSGVVGVTGTLNRDNMVVDDTGCSWHQTNVSQFNLIGGDVFTLDVTETDNQFTTACGNTIPTGGSCVSVYSFTFNMPTPNTDAGTGG